MAGSKLEAATLPPITQELWDRISKTFPPMEINPSTTHECIMFNAGQVSVVKWLKQFTGGKKLLGQV